MSEITQYEIDERKLVQLEITDKIDELLDLDNISMIGSRTALHLIKTFIRYMDEED